MCGAEAAVACSWRSRSPQETEALGEAFGRVLKEGEVLLLHGPLGVGKTTFVQGLGRGLEVPDTIKSPTFPIHMIHPGRLTLHHMDLYRIKSERELEELGFDEFLGKEGVCVIEWAEKMLRSWDWAMKVSVKEVGVEGRTITVEGPASRIEQLRAEAAAGGLEENSP